MFKASFFVFFARYQNGRIVAQQGRSPDRFYFIMAGKILVVKEIHVSNSVISKTVSVLTKGSTTSVRGFFCQQHEISLRQF